MPPFPDLDVYLERSNSQLVRNKFCNFFGISHNRDESSSISLTNRPVSSTIADRFLNQLLLPEEAKELDRISASFTKTEASLHNCQFYSKTFNLVETQTGYKPNSPRTAELEELRGTCSIYLANFRRILIIIDKLSI